MREVSVIGVGMSRFGKHIDTDTVDIAWPAIKAAMADAGVTRDDIQITYSGSVYGGMMTGQRTLARLGMAGKPIINVENACSSSSSAFHQAHLAVGSGQCDVALVMGAEKLTKFGGGTIPLVDEDWEISQGMLMPALYAMRAMRYMFETGLTGEQLAKVVVKARKHGALNADAQFQNEVDLDEVMNARPITDPFTLLHCCGAGDGAAAAIICATEIAGKFEGTPIKVMASHLCTGKFMPGFRDMTVPEITVRGAAEAYEHAGLGPEDIDVAEVHDAFSIAELLYYEAFGFCGRGDAIGLIEDGVTSLGGAKPVNPSGGLLSKGHPVGATGVAQITEIVRQLRGQCGPRQFEGARIGLAHATGGGAMGMDHGA
ncbi:MAG: thiolase family protein, partial [Rhodospirillales bacterium]|nr:thiolase family protein [Rhodospirillales bacterium]